jgi:hypothetical protein
VAAVHLAAAAAAGVLARHALLLLLLLVKRLLLLVQCCSSWQIGELCLEEHTAVASRLGTVLLLLND